MCDYVRNRRAAICYLLGRLALRMTKRTLSISDEMFESIAMFEALEQSVGSVDAIAWGDLARCDQPFGTDEELGGNFAG